MARTGVGTIGWVDLTVPDAERVRDFYRAVVGWEPRPHGMGDYHDYEMLAPADGRPAAGVRYARGVNAEIPPVWLVYVTVEDVRASVERCVALGGEVVVRHVNGVVVIRDPAGAVLALAQAPPAGGQGSSSAASSP